MDKIYCQNAFHEKWVLGKPLEKMQFMPFISTNLIYLSPLIIPPVISKKKIVHFFSIYFFNPTLVGQIDFFQFQRKN
jgi:hypothetical protein